MFATTVLNVTSKLHNPHLRPVSDVCNGNVGVLKVVLDDGDERLEGESPEPGEDDQPEQRPRPGPGLGSITQTCTITGQRITAGNDTSRSFTIHLQAHPHLTLLLRGGTHCAPPCGFSHVVLIGGV